MPWLLCKSYAPRRVRVVKRRTGLVETERHPHFFTTMFGWLLRFFPKKNEHADPRTPAPASPRQTNASPDSSTAAVVIDPAFDEGTALEATRPRPTVNEIDPALDEYPDGLPRDWGARKRQILERDGFICQAPGCWGRELDIHHVQPRSTGGNHRAENLVSLCSVHHALVHLETNVIKIRSSRCTIVSRHVRRNSVVDSFVRRFQRITPSELKVVRETFNLKCKCGSLRWTGYLRERDSTIRIFCPDCGGRWLLEAGLREETATHLATLLEPTINPRRFKFDLSLIRGIARPRSYEVCPACARSHKEGYLKKKRFFWVHYIGCSEWPRCPYVRPM